MAIGFDLTNIAPAPTQAPAPQQPVAPNPPQYQQPAPPPQPMTDPNAPKTLNEALTKPITAELVDEEGNEFSDKLTRRAPGLKKQLWQVDKFAAAPEPVRVVNKEGKQVWVDRRGNHVLDPNTGNVLLTPPDATAEDRQEINHTEAPEPLIK